MKNIIIGTAGHIDHGKTTLIRALTGHNTDRLKEEKERGITIELGFTYFDLPSGRRAGIIDVPGHERFVKNMLAGVIGMDIVMLVIAADEGIMPQTKEHLDILTLLDIKCGMVVVTKKDSVDEEWLELVIEDIKEYLKGSFLENSPILPVSSITGEGISEVIDTIDKMTEKVVERDITDTPRLPIDRVFTISGFGTVVTGTLISGMFKVGEEVQIYPSGLLSKIRSLQVHGNDSSFAYAGQRVAINLTGLKKDDINRGEVVAPVNSMKDTMMLDVKLKLLKDSPRIIENRSRVRLFIGTSEVLCRVILLDKDNLTPGESCYAQLRLEEKVIAKRGDRFIIRFYSPITTIGGGIILEANPPKRKRFQDEVLKELKIKESDDLKLVLETIVKDNSVNFLNLKEFSSLTVIPYDKIKDLIIELVNDNKVLMFNLSSDSYPIHIEFFNKIKKDMLNFIRNFHKENPLKVGVLKEEIRSRFLVKAKPKLGEAIIDKLIELNEIKKINEFLALKDFEIIFSKLHHEIKVDIEKEYLIKKFSVIKKDDLFEQIKYSKEDIEKVYQALIDQQILIKLDKEILIHKNILNEGIKIIKNFVNSNGYITVSDFRDLVNTNRKMAIAFLEYLDKTQVTKRVEDKRILNIC